MLVEKINSWYDQGTELLSLGRYGEAVKCYDKITQLKPDSKLAWAYKGLLFSKLKRYDEAFKCYETALKCYAS